jgi:diguanylate cyclase (GGDEF)-like protein
MNLQAIIIADAFGLVILISLLVSLALTKQRRRLEDKLFMILIFVVMAANIIEPLGFYLDEKPGAFCGYTNLLGSTYLYMANIICGFVWNLFVDLKLYRDKDRLKKMLPLYGALPAVYSVLLLINLFVPFLFTVDETNTFRRLEWCWIMYLLVVISAGISIFIYCNYQRTHDRALFFPVWMFMIPVLVGSLAQGFFYGISTAWPSAAIGIVALYMSLQNEKTFTDPLTGLFNRLFLEHTLENAKGTEYYGIMLDLNFFKNINDSYGHSAGDRALNEAGRIIKSAIHIKGSAYRYAGDEYVVMLRTSSEEDVIATEERIRTEADRFNAENKEPYKLSFAMGHAKLEKDDTQDGFLRKIDNAMYLDKQKVHQLMAWAGGTPKTGTTQSNPGL